MTNRVGQAEPLYCSAVGKALLSGLEPEAIRARLEGTAFERFTERTIGSVADLLAECERVRAEGLAHDNEEYRPGVRCLAAPVRDFSGAVVAAVGVSGPASRMGPERCEAVGAVLKQVSNELSHKIGFLTGSES